MGYFDVLYITREHVVFLGDDLRFHKGMAWKQQEKKRNLAPGCTALRQGHRTSLSFSSRQHRLALVVIDGNGMFFAGLALRSDLGGSQEQK